MLDAALQVTGFDVRLPDTIPQVMWAQWVILAMPGGVDCLLGGTIGEIEAVPESAALP